MFESYKIRKLISQLISSPGQGNRLLIRSLRPFGQTGIDALSFAFKGGKITEADMKRYLTIFFDKDALDIFIKLLGDSKEQVRVFARETIFEKGGGSVISRLIEFLEEGDFLQRRGLTDLIKRLGSLAILNKVVPLLDKGDRELKRAAMDIVAGIGGSAGSSYILPLLKSSDWWVRKRAVEVLCKIKDSANVEPLLELLNSEKDPKIKNTIIQALGEIGDAKSAHLILPNVSDKDMIVRQMVVEAMEKIADASIIRDLLTLMKNSDVNVRRAGAEILEQLKDPKATETLIKCLQDKDWWVREIATDALAEFKGTNLNQKVMVLFKHPEENVRRSAVEFFCRTPSESAFDEIVGMLKDVDWWVREKSVIALGRLKDRRAIRNIIELIDDPDVRWAIPAALGEIGGRKAAEYLCEYLGYPDRSVRLASLKALGNMKNKTYLPQIKDAVMDSDAEVRDTALKIVKALTGRSVRASQIIEEKERLNASGDGTIFSSPTPANTNILFEAILVLDLCNSTLIAANYGDEFAFRLTNRLVEITKPVAARYHVKFTKSTGDGYLMTFSGVKDALSFAKEIMKSIEQKNKGVQENERIDIRIAVNMGETRLDSKGDRLGTAVNMAFRVEGVKPDALIQSDGGMKPEDMPLDNRILITEPVQTELAKLKKFSSRLVGFFELKGISGRHRIFQLA